MAVKFNNAEGGTNSNTVTAGDTNSGDAWSNVTVGASASVIWDNTHAAHGSLAIKYATGGSSVTAYTAWTGLSIARIRFRANVYITASPPTVTQTIARGLAATAQKFRVTVESDGKLHVRDNANTQVGSTSASIPANQWVRIEGDITAGTSAAFEVRYYSSVDSTSITETVSGSAANFGSANFDEIRFGVGAGFANVAGYWLDDLGISDSAFMGPALKTGTATGGLGALTGSAAGQRTVLATASGPLGALSGSAASRRTVLATASGALGALTGTAASKRTVLGIAAAPLGSLSGSAASKRTVLATATAALGALSGSATGLRGVLGTAAGPLGVLVGSAAGSRTVVGLASADLGTLDGHAASQREVLGVADGPFGVLVGAAVGIGTSGSPITPRPNTGTTSRPDSGMTARPDTGITPRP